MKPQFNRGLSRPVVGVMCLLLSLASELRAADSTNNAAPVICCDVKFIEVPRAEVNRLFNITDYTLAPEKLNRVQEWVDQKKAVIIAQPRISTISGIFAQVRAVREVIYPTEYGTSDYPHEGEPGKTNETGQVNTVLPQSFKTREGGILLNITPTLREDLQDRISITLIPEVSWLSRVGFIKHEIVTPRGKTEVSQPDFYSWNLATSVDLISGTTVLLAIVEPVREEQYNSSDNVVLVLLSASVNRSP